MNQREEAQEGKGKKEENSLAAAAARRLKLLKERTHKGFIKSPERMAAEQKTINDALRAEINARDAKVSGCALDLNAVAWINNIRVGTYGYAWTGDHLRSTKGSCQRRRANTH